MASLEEGTQVKVLQVDSKDMWDSYVSQDKTMPYTIFSFLILGEKIVAHFSAEWCIPSVAMKPFIEELASTYQDVLFLTIDVDDVKEVASQYEVKAMPTFVLIKKGDPVDKLVGANPDEIKKRIEALA